MILDFIKSNKDLIDRGLFKKNLLLRALSSRRVPLLFLCSPQIVELSENESVVKIPLQFTTKNHVGSMYFGALAMGAELSVALPVVFAVFEQRQPFNFLFTQFNCEFIKKAKEDIYFVFSNVTEQRTFMNRLQPGESGTLLSDGAAYLASDYAARTSPVIKYKIGINIKNTKKAID